MTLVLTNVKRIIAVLAMCSTVALAIATPATPAAHAATTLRQSLHYLPCGSYHGNYWGYSYGYYKGDDITNRLQDQDGYDGYDYGSVWYKGYYPDEEYFYFFSYQPSYFWHTYGDYRYRCFAPHISSVPAPGLSY
jgi:hypothetical protein